MPDFCDPYRSHGFCPVAEFLGCMRGGKRDMCPKSEVEARRAVTAYSLIEYHGWLKRRYRIEYGRLFILEIVGRSKLSLAVSLYLLQLWLWLHS